MTNGGWVRCFGPDKIYLTFPEDSNLGPYKRKVSSLPLCYLVILGLTFVKDLFILWWCYVGWPSPRLTWWQDNDMVDDSMDQPRDNRVSNTLTIQRVSRDLLDSRIECRASSTPLLDPVVIFLTLDILCECPILSNGFICSDIEVFNQLNREYLMRLL